MAATSTINSNYSSMRNEGSRQEIQAAIAKAAELRAIHAALMQGSSPTHPSLFPSSSPPPPPPPPQIPRPPSQLPVHDYPVFTPSYDDEPLPGYCHIQLACSEGWGDYTKETGSSRKDLPPPSLANLDAHFQTEQDARSVTGSYTNQITVLQTSPTAEALRSRRRNSLGDFKSVSSCKNCKHGANDADSIASSASCKHSNMIVPLTDSHMALHSHQPKTKGTTVFSRLFPMLKKKPKGENSIARTESEEVSQILKDLGVLSVETLKKELLEANQKRDSALAEVAEMKSSFGDLRKKLESLEGYCEELKKGLKQTVQANGSSNRSPDNGMPVSEEVMVEGFIQIVSEARLSVKQFCKNLVGQIEQTDDQQINNFNSLLRPYKLSLSSNHSKAILYHLEAIINSSLYQDFENSVFQKNGPQKLLDPQQDRQAQFSSFVALRNLSWNEVLRKGTKYHSEEFSKFCDQKMSCIITTLNWIRPWPEQLLQSFFVAAKCIWLLHLLAFSFFPPLTILRVQENRPFDPRYMEDLMMDRQRAQQGQIPTQVKIMVMPGFYVQDKILKCKVLCRCKSTM